MQIVIKIPKRVYDYILKTNNIVNSDRLEVTEAIVSGTPIPDNATNGDVIKAMFPNIKVNVSGGVVRSDRYTQFDLSWWNAPYQKGGKDEVN